MIINMRFRAVGRSAKFIRKNPASWNQKNVRKINWYSSYELFKIFSFMILVSCPKWSRSCFATWYKIFSNITHQPALRKARSNTVPIFSEYALGNLLVQESYLYPGLTFDFIRQRKEARSSCRSFFKLSSA